MVYPDIENRGKAAYSFRKGFMMIEVIIWILIISLLVSVGMYNFKVSSYIKQIRIKRYTDKICYTVLKYRLHSISFFETSKMIIYNDGKIVFKNKSESTTIEDFKCKCKLKDKGYSEFSFTPSGITYNLNTGANGFELQVSYEEEVKAKIVFSVGASIPKIVNID